MYGGMPLFLTFMTILIVCNTAIHVMIQMYFEGHRAFNDESKTHSVREKSKSKP